MARIGVFVCWCGSNIAETVDSEGVAKYAAKLPGVVVSVDYKYTCSDPGQKMITDAIKEHKLTGVVVASCSPRMHEKTFRKTAAGVGLNPYLLEMANIREHCSWVHHNKAEGTEKAKTLVRMCVERVKRNTNLYPIKVPVTNRALVIGGGIAGIQAALDIAQEGHEVVIVEKNPSIGGHMSQLDETFPTLDCSQCILTPRMVEIMQSENISMHTFSEVESLEGYIGNFKVNIRKKARTVDLEKCTGCGDCWNNCMARNKIQEPVKITKSETIPDDVKITVDALLKKYPDETGMVIGILQDIQKEYNYLRQDAIEYLSEKADIPLSRLYGIARFYHTFSLEPRGEHIIRICLGTACHLKGAGNISDSICKELDIGHGETTKDMLFTFERVNCLGACALAPILTINDKYHSHVTVKKMMKFIDRCRERSEKVAV